MMTDVPARLLRPARPRSHRRGRPRRPRRVRPRHDRQPSRPRRATTCPAAASRLYAEAVGIEHVVVGGETIVERGVLTGAEPGTVLRSGVDTDTVTVPGVARDV